MSRRFPLRHCWWLVGLLLATLVVLIGNFLADIAYAALDPRISFRALEAA